MASQPRLQARAGISLGQSFEDLERVRVNTDVSGGGHIVDGSHFSGVVYVRIQHFLGSSEQLQEPREPESGYFDKNEDDAGRKAERKSRGYTWSIALRGRFKQPTDADDVLWGNVWRKPIRDHLPYGTSAALRFVNYVDPDLTHDVYGDQPWALSPLIATMNYVRTTRLGQGEPFPYTEHEPVTEDVRSLLRASPEASIDDASGGAEPAEAFRDILKSAADVDSFEGDVQKRKKFFGKPDHRKKVTFTPDDVVEASFDNGYINFETLALKLPVGGLEFKLQSYWDGQPVTFACRNRSGDKTFFVVALTIDEKSPKAE